MAERFVSVLVPEGAFDEMQGYRSQKDIVADMMLEAEVEELVDCLIRLEAISEGDDVKVSFIPSSSIDPGSDTRAVEVRVEGFSQEASYYIIQNTFKNLN